MSPSRTSTHWYNDQVTPSESKPRVCSVARTLDIVGEKWALLAIREVFLGNRRFDEMVRCTGAPRRSLNPGEARQGAARPQSKSRTNR